MATFDPTKHTSIEYAITQAIEVAAKTSTDISEVISGMAELDYATRDDWNTVIPKNDNEFWRRLRRLCQLWPWMRLPEEALIAGESAFATRNWDLAAKLIHPEYGPEETALFYYLQQSVSIRTQR